jgi:FixJ family two-component response regulator
MIISSGLSTKVLNFSITSCPVTAKIIFLSADNRMKEEALSKGALRFFTKPMDIKYFIAVVKELLGNNNGSI